MRCKAPDEARLRRTLVVRRREWPRRATRQIAGFEMTSPAGKTRIALVGNPNVGKSVIFGLLTGHYESVSNYPGTTVEVSHGHVSIAGKKVTIVDTPGTNTLIPMSEDERVTRDILLNGEVDAVLQVADAKNLKRALLLSVQIAEMGIPFLLNLNMEDEQAARGIAIDKAKLSSLLGVPVVGTVAIQKRGLKELKKGLSLSAPSPKVPTYSAEIEGAIKELESILPETPIGKRSVALMLLSGDESLAGWLHQKISPEKIETIDRICGDLAKRFSRPVAYLIDRQRLHFIDGIAGDVLCEEKKRRGGVSAFLGKISMHPVWGVFTMLCVLAVMYEFVGNLGAQTLVEILEDTLFNGYINPQATLLFSKIFFFSQFLRDLFVGPYGIITMAFTYAFAIILPIVTTFFIFFGLIEDSGYLPRLGIMLNRIFRAMGLNGKAVIPMVLGLGCDTMATMTARILDTRKEKIILTLLLALGIPCSAQLGIILGMLGELPIWVTFLWGGVVIASILSVGFLASLILPGARSDFLVEIPPIRRPTFLNVASKTLARLEWYLKEVVPLFVIGTFVLFLLDRFSLLPVIQRLADPIVTGMLGLPTKATEAFIVGFLRRDYAATHFFELLGRGDIDTIQAVVAMIVITLFVPCLANLLMIIKERGMKVAIAIMLFVYPFAFLVGGGVNYMLRGLEVWRLGG